MATDLINLNKEEMLKENSKCDKVMKFYIPPGLHSKTPVPKDSSVFIEEVPEMEVAVIKFPGFASMNDYLKQRDILIKKLGSESQEYDTVNIITAGYDPPVKLINRRNEVWLRKL